ncbi:MAG: glycosyltransferase [Roseimicrobium sp.]
MKVTVLMPCFEDAVTAAELVEETAGFLRSHGHEASFLIVDDGSQSSLAKTFDERLPESLDLVWLLELKRNLGHQRAIACGLCYLAENAPDVEAVVIMDSDGEDRPEDVPKLVEIIEKNGGPPAIVFAERMRRTECFSFRLGYRLYLAMHWFLAGHAPRVGNFSALPMSLLPGLVTDADLWSHYAATIWKSRRRRVLLPVPRGRRRRGSSHLGLGGLVLHGLAAISCYRETLALRMLAGCALLLVGTGTAFAVALVTATWTQAAMAAGLAFGVMVSLSLLAFSQCFLVLQNRHQSTMLPVHDYVPFIHQQRQLRPRVSQS